MARSRWLALAVASGIASSALGVTIGFNALTGVNGDPYPGSEESGFRVRPLVGDWYKRFSTGRPVPAISWGDVFNHIHYAQFELTRTDGGLFTFETLDVYPDRDSCSCGLTGYRNGVRVIYDGGTISGGGWRTFGSVLTFTRGRQVDRLDIEFTTIGYDLGAIDNIVLKPVPEPDVALTLGLGLSVAAFIRRRAKQPRI